MLTVASRSIFLLFSLLICLSLFPSCTLSFYFNTKYASECVLVRVRIRLIGKSVYVFCGAAAAAAAMVIVVAVLE